MLQSYCERSRSTIFDYFHSRTAPSTAITTTTTTKIILFLLLPNSSLGPTEIIGHWIHDAFLLFVYSLHLESIDLDSILTDWLFYANFQEITRIIAGAFCICLFLHFLWWNANFLLMTEFFNLFCLLSHSFLSFED